MPILSESTFQKFTLLKTREVVLDYSSIGNANECEFQLPVFTDGIGVDAYKNDFTSSLLQLSNRYSTPEFYLEVQNGCEWDEVAQLNDNTYGTYYPTFTSQPNWSGFVVQWYKVYNLLGENCYRIRQQYNDIFDAEVEVNYSYKYNLKLYNDNLADETTKFTYTINGGKIGSTLNDEIVIDYKDIVWNKEVRLPRSFFGFESSEYTREFTRFKNGAEEWIEDSQVETIQYYCKRLPYSLHRELKITALQSGNLSISDYNLNNPKLDKYNMKRVIPSSGYEPTWATYTTFAPIQLTFEPYYNNLRRKRC